MRVTKMNSKYSNNTKNSAFREFTLSELQQTICQSYKFYLKYKLDNVLLFGILFVVKFNVFIRVTVGSWGKAESLMNPCQIFRARTELRFAVNFVPGEISRKMSLNLTQRQFQLIICCASFKL